jgi:dienelactone hydrolase
LKDVHDKVTCPVLTMYGEDDLYVADGVQEKLFRQAFGNSRHYAVKVFTKDMGSAEHCQIGAIEQAVQAFEDWMKESGLLFGFTET